MQARQDADPDWLGQWQGEVQRHPRMQGKAGAVVDTAVRSQLQFIAACIGRAGMLHQRIGRRVGVSVLRIQVKRMVMLLRCQPMRVMLRRLRLQLRLGTGLLHRRTAARMAGSLAGQRHTLHRQGQQQAKGQQTMQDVHALDANAKQAPA